MEVPFHHKHQEIHRQNRVRYFNVSKSNSFVEADSKGNRQHDLMYINIPQVTQEMRTKAIEIQNALGFFKNAKFVGRAT